MTETPDAAVVPPEAESGSFFGNLFNLYFEPTATFAKIFAKPRVLVVLALQTILAVTFTSIWLQKADVKEMVKQKMELNPRVQEMTPEQVERVAAMQVSVLRASFRFAPFLFPALGALILGGFLMFVFRFFLAAEVSFLQSMATVAWSFLAFSVVHTPIALSVFLLKEDWATDPNELVQTNPALFVDQASVSGWLWGLLTSLDLFSFWMIFLLATGYSVAGKLKIGTCLWVIGSLWAMMILLKVASIAAFS